MAKIRTSKSTAALNKYESQDLSSVLETVKNNRKDYTFSDEEVRELGKSIEQDLAFQEALEQAEIQKRKDKEAELANKQLEAELNKGGLIQGLGNFWDGLNSSGDAGKYVMLPNGKYLKRKDNTNFFEDVSNAATSLFVSPLAGIDIENNTYNSDWEEVSPEEVSDFVNTQAKRKDAQGAFHAGFMASSFFNDAYQFATKDAISGLAGVLKNDASVTGNQSVNLLNTITSKFNDMQMSALKNLNLEDSDYYKHLELANKNMAIDTSNRTASIRKNQEERAKEIANNGGEGLYSKTIDYLLSTEDNQRYTNQQRQIRDLIKQTAVSLSGQEKPEFLMEAEAGQLDNRTIDINGNSVPMEYTETGSNWDAKKLMTDDKGNPLLDDSGNPVYGDKYSLMDKLSKANLSSLFTKYGSEDLTDAAASSIGFLAGGYGTSAIMRGVGKGIAKGASSLGKVGNISERGLRMLENVTNKLDDLSPKLKNTGGSQAILNRSANAFNKSFQTTLNSYVMTNAESQGIGEEAAKNVYNSKIDEAANINTDEIYKEIYRQNPEITEAEAQLRLEATVSSLRDNFAKTNPDRVNDIMALSLAAKETAASLNNMNTVFNLNFGAAFAKGKSLSRNILKSPLSGASIATGVYNTLGEGVQEYFEEGLFNSYSQKAAEEFAKGNELSILDFVDNEFITRENVTSGLIGMLSGAGQNAVMNGIQTPGKLSAYRKQQNNINEFKKLVESRPEDLKDILELALDSKDFNEFQIQQQVLGEEIEKLEKDGKHQEAKTKREELKGLTEKLFINKAVRAASMGTSEKLTEALQQLASNEEFTEEERLNFNEAIQLNEMVADLHDKYLYYHGNSSIIGNRANKFLLSKFKNDLSVKHSAQILSDYDRALDIETSNQMSTSGLTVSDAEYSAAFDQLKTRVKLDPLKNKAAENKLKYDEAVNQIDSLINKLDEQFYEVTSREGQEKLAKKKKEIITKDLSKKVNYENEAQVKETIKEETGNITPEAVNEVENTSYKNQVKTQAPFDAKQFLAQNATVVGNDVKQVEEKASQTPVEAVQHSKEELAKYLQIMNEAAGGVEGLSDEADNDVTMRFMPVIKYNSEDEAQTNMVNAIAQGFKKDLEMNPNVTLDGAIARFAIEQGFFKVGQYFDIIVEGWGKATGNPMKPADKKALYNSYFGVENALDVLNQFSQTPSTPGNTQTSAKPLVETVSSPKEENSAMNPLALEQATPIREEGINTNTDLTEAQIPNPVNSGSGNLTASSNPKLAFLGLEYNVSPDGQTYTTATTNILDSAKPFLDPRNFKVGDTHDLTFNFNYLLNPSNTLRFWYKDSVGNDVGQLISVEDRIAQIFPELSFLEFTRILQTDPRRLLANDEFLKMIPVGIVFEDEILEGGLNDYDWWNSRNVADTIDEETRKSIPYSANKIILDGRRKNLEMREAILNSESFSVNVKITDNTSKYYNKLLLTTPKEIAQGYSDTFLSVSDSFSNDVDYMEKNTAMGYIANGKIFSGKYNGTQKLIIGGKEINQDQIENLVALKQAIQDEAVLQNNTSYSPDSGRRVLVAKSGYDKNNKPVYTAHLVITNHESKQEQFKNMNTLLDRIVAGNVIENGSYLPSYGWVLKNLSNASELARFPKITTEYINTAKKIGEIFKTEFKIDITKDSQVTDGFKNFYPVRNPNRKEEFTQNINSFAKPLHKNGIPDIASLFDDGSTVTQALEKILRGELGFITPQQLYAKNSHTQYVFTPIDKDGEVLYSNVAQKRITFDFSNRETSEAVVNVIQQKLDEAKKEVEFLRRGLETRPDDTTIQDSLEIAEEKVKNLEIKVSEEKVETETNPKPENQTEQEQIEFSESDINDINNEVFYKALSRIDINNFSKQSIIDAATQVFDEVYQDLKSRGLEREAQFMFKNKNNILGIGVYDGSLKELIDVTFDLPIESEFETEEQGTVNLTSENSKDYTKESFEQDIKTSLGMKVKAVLSGITDTRFTETTFGGFRQTIPLNEILDFLQQALAESDNNTLASLTKTALKKIEKNPKDFGFYKEVIDRLNDPKLIESGVINEILYNMYQAKLDMNFILYSQNADGTFTAKNYDANSKSPIIVKRNKWKENLKLSSLINRYEEGYYSIDKNEAAKIFELRDVIKESLSKGQVDTLALEEFLSSFGIKLNPITIATLLEENLPEITGANLSSDGFILMDKGLVDILTQNLSKAIEYQDKGIKLSTSSEYVTSDKETMFDLLTNNNAKNLNTIIAVDNALSAISMTSIYVGGKIVNAFTKPNQISNTVKKLKSNPELEYGEDNKLQSFFSILKQTPITEDSLIVEMLENDPRFKSYFDVVNISLEALKERGEKSRTDREITDLSDKDEFITLFNLFSHLDGEITNDEYSSRFGGIKFRRGTIAFPTLSDSSQKPLMKTALLNLRTEDFTDNSITRLSEEVLDYTMTHLLVPNFKRVAQYIFSNSQVNVAGHNVGAMFFTDLPSFNYTGLSITLDSEGLISEEGRQLTLPAIEVFKLYINQGKTIEDFITDYRQEIHSELHRNLDAEVSRYISEDGTSGLLVDENIFTGTDIKYIDTAYLNNKDKQTGNQLTKARLLMYDYVINYMVNQKEIQTLFAGDIANFFKDKHAKNFSENRNSFPINTQDIINHFYINNQDRIKDLIQAKEFNTLLREFPQLQGSQELFPDIDSDIRLAMNLPIQQAKFNNLMKDVQNNLSKRLKGLLSPGSQLPNSTGNKKYYQIMVNDVESASEVLLTLSYLKYPELREDGNFAIEVMEFKEIDDILEDQRTDEQKKRHNSLLKKFKKEYPKVASYFSNATTDAQEYATWRDNLEQLLDQGRITLNKYNKYKAKLESQSRNGVNPSNELSFEEMQDLIMQTTKPLHSGLYYEEHNGYHFQRYVYVKSSSFPLLPQLTKMFPKLENLRKNLEGLETEDITVRMSYESANKVGGPLAGGANLSTLYKDGLTAEEKESLLSNSALLLDRSNFYIQQDKPFKSDKNAKAGKVDYINRATQFEKIILGDGISKIEEQIFPNKFSSEILNSLGITPTDNKVSGKELQKIYNELYRREQSLLKNKLLRDLGIERSSDMFSGNPKSMRKLVSLLNKRLNNKQDRKALELIYYGRNENGNIIKGSQQDLINAGYTDIFKAEFKIPLYMTPNSKKFESVLNSVVNKGLINLKLPGFSSPVASQQGFDIKGFGDVSHEGLITTPNFNPKKGLQATLDRDGKLTHAQVFMPSKFKTYNEVTGEYEYIDLKDFVQEGTNIIDTNKIPEELLQLFSFRIPTSAHQSGIMIEIAGFLLHSMGDLLIVPKDHTTQIGEDYDIDVRYMYNQHYIKDENGNLKVLDYSDYESPRTVDEVREEYNQFKEQLFNEFFRVSMNEGTATSKTFVNNPYWKTNQETLWEIHFLQEAIDSQNLTRGLLDTINNVFGVNFSEDLLENEEETLSVDSLKERIAELESQLIPSDLVKTKGDQLKKEYKEVSKDLRKAFIREEKQARRLMNDLSVAINKEKHDLKVIENNIVGMYKSVFSSPDENIRNIISAILSTDFSEGTASAMDNLLSSTEDNSVFNVYSPFNQRSIFKLGASGKMGIGVHSNAVTMNSLLQQYDSEANGELAFYNTSPDGDIEIVNIVLGKLLFDGILGKVEKNGRRISESVMESQNSATDNQKLQIMGRRNEDKNTINVLAVLQATGNDFDGFVLRDLDGKETPMSYASMFINQPIIRDYSKLMNKYSSSTSSFKGDVNQQIEKDLFEKWGKHVPNAKWFIRKGVNTRRLNQEASTTSGPKIDGSFLYNNLLEEDARDNATEQWYIYENFLKLKGAATHYNRLQRFINIENGGLGISYFDTIDLMKELIAIATGDVQILNSEKLIGDLKVVDLKENVYRLDENGNEVQVLDYDYSDEDLDVMRTVTTPESIAEQEKKIAEYESMGYIRVQLNNSSVAYMIKPENHYAHKIVNSITTGYELWNSIFPYDSTHVEEVINDIIDSGRRMSPSEATELKYKVISELKDYVYSNSVDLFEGNSDIVSKQLFFDYNNEDGTRNESLASYLLRLSENPAFKNKLFKQNFFKDLVFDINEDTYPSTIRYNSSDVSKSYNLTTYSIFEKLMNSKTELPEFNGQPYSYELLMRDLLKYSILADQGNGAIGFRHLLPISLFDKFGVSDSVKLQTDIKNKNIQNLVFNGVEKAISNFFETDLDETSDIIINRKSKSFEQVSTFVRLVNNKYKDLYGVDNVLSIVNTLGDVKINITPQRDTHSTFVRQFFQHNPEYAATIGNLYRNSFGTSATKKLKKVLEANGIAVTDDFTKISELVIQPEDSMDNFITLTDNNGRRVLFERVNGDGLYLPLPKLGVFGYNEYSVGKYKDKSNVAKNNIVKNVNAKVGGNALLDYFDKTSLAGVIQDIASSSSPYQAVFKFIAPFTDLKSQKIKISDINGKAYIDNGIIHLNRNWLQNTETTKLEVQKAILEEMLHKVTEETISKYVDIVGFDDTGKPVYNYKQTEIPTELKELLSVYEEAIEYVVNKYGLEEFLNNVRKKDGHIINVSNENPDEQILKGLSMYRVSNIHEFVAGIFIRDEAFAREMGTVKSKNDKTILENFVEKVLRMINTLADNFFEKGTIGTETIRATYEFLANNFDTINNSEDVTLFKESNNVAEAIQFIQENSLPPVPAMPTASQISSPDEVSWNIEQPSVGPVETPSKNENTALIYKNDVRPIVLREVEGVQKQYRAQTVKVPGYKAWFGVIKLQNGNIALVTDVFPNKDGGNVVVLNNDIKADANGSYGVAIKELVDKMVATAKNPDNIRKLVEGNDNLSNFENINKC